MLHNINNTVCCILKCISTKVDYSVCIVTTVLPATNIFHMKYTPPAEAFLLHRTRISLFCCTHTMCMLYTGTRSSEALRRFYEPMASAVHRSYCVYSWMCDLLYSWVCGPRWFGIIWRACVYKQPYLLICIGTTGKQGRYISSGIA